MNKILSKWIGAYEAARRLQASRWSENDVLAKAHEIYALGKNVQFTLMAEWQALRDQLRYSSQLGGSIGSGSSGSKRSHESDACGSNSVGSSARPMAYKLRREIEETYILNRFRECRQKILEYNAPRTRKYLNRDHAAANQRLIDDYFANEPTYDDPMFRRRYRMQKHVFLQIVKDLSSSDDYFTQRVDAANKEGISPLAKCNTAMRMLAYGMTADAVDEYIRIGGTTTLECLRRFCKGIIRLYEQVYLRAPTQDDLQKLLHGNAPSVNFFVNQRPYNMPYYLDDGIYPSYPTFIKSIRLPQSEPDKLFAKYQEGYRKVIERAFGVLQARFKIIREPAHLWDIADLGIIMRSCIILHNMTVEDGGDSYAQRWTNFEQSEESATILYRVCYPLL
ncbi:uncharacterized protein LOC123904745 [Trifolium pratense]|uniref:uncharacterized protein LOC123904745 n=1 Tax=Trifolium pratense TaxID=57577 RepID=UPI001E694375|nr:uncharacterized protein LOC123904745 [Trifolium pratense]